MHHPRFKRVSLTGSIVHSLAVSIAVVIPSLAVAHRASATQLFMSFTYDDPCYWVTASGRRIGLGQLCGDAPPKTALTTIQTPANRSSDGVIRVKIKRHIASTPVIEVTFNGTHRFDMIVDTGASASLITQTMAQELNIKPVKTLQAGIANGSVVQFPVAYVQSMSVSGLTANRVEVAIADQMDVGLLGHDFFGRYDIKIKRDVVEFYPR